MTGKYDQLLSQAVYGKYKNPEKTKVEANIVIKQYQSLYPRKESFVFNDGTEKELINLGGTIPVRYKGNTYNIPICIWLLDNFPKSAPMVFVRPTMDMLIKPSRHVDQNGKVYLPYLHEWDSSSSDLLGLVQIMIMIFAETPPVYSKPRNSSPPQYPPAPYPTQPSGYMPVPGAATGPSSSLPYPTQPPGGAVPPYPYPSTGPAPYPAGQSAAPYPPGPSPYPPGASGPSPYPVYHPQPTSQTPYPTSALPPYPTNPPGGAPYPAYTPPSNNFGAMTGDASSNQQQGSNTGTISEEHIRISLISAASHIVSERLKDVYGTAQAEVSALRQQQTDLNKGKAKLEGLITKLNGEQAELDRAIRHLQEKENELKSVLDKVQEDTEPMDIDKAVTTTAPIYKQLLQSYAEDQATQDAIYYLGEALRRGVLDLDAYLKHVRSLSRRQFQMRATMNKCRSKANLPG